MSFKIILLGIASIFLTFGLTALVILNIIPPQIYMVGNVIVGILDGLTILLIAILMNGVIGPMLAAKMQGKTLLINITASKTFELLSGHEKEGMVETDKGYFHALPDAMYTLPNGIRSAITYFKYAVTLPREFIVTTSNLKRAGVRDYNTLQVITAQAAAKNQELISQ